VLSTKSFQGGKGYFIQFSLYISRSQEGGDRDKRERRVGWGIPVDTGETRGGKNPREVTRPKEFFQLRAGCRTSGMYLQTADVASTTEEKKVRKKL